MDTRQIIFGKTIYLQNNDKNWAKGQASYAKITQTSVKMQKIKTESNIIRHINIYKVRQTKTVN